MGATDARDEEETYLHTLIILAMLLLWVAMLRYSGDDTPVEQSGMYIPPTSMHVPQTDRRNVPEEDRESVDTLPLYTERVKDDSSEEQPPGYGTV